MERVGLGSEVTTPPRVSPKIHKKYNPVYNVSAYIVPE